MSYELHQDKHQHSGGIVASTLVPRTPVRLAGTSVPLWIPCASSNEEPTGMTGAATHLQGEVPVVYFSQNVVKARCIASVGVGAQVGQASSNGGVGPVAAAASGLTRWAIGSSLTAAAAGEVVSIYVNPRQLSGNLP